MGWLISEDTYKGAVDNPLSLNRYAYVANNPLKFVDPSGHINVIHSDGNGKTSFLLNPWVKGFSLGISESIYKVQYTPPYSLENLAANVELFVSIIPAIKTEEQAGKLISSGTKSLITSGNKAEDVSKDLTTLFRAVGPEEFYDVIKTGKFSVTPQGLQAKQFGLSFDETLKFADKYSDIGAIIEVKIPTEQLNKLADFTQVDKFIFKSGTVTIHVDKLDDFNKMIQEISHKF